MVGKENEGLFDQSLLIMSEDYALLGGKRQGVFTKAVLTGSLVALIVAVIIGIVISTQVAKLPKAQKALNSVNEVTVNPDWEVCVTIIVIYRIIIVRL